MSAPWSSADEAGGFPFAEHDGRLAFIFVGGVHPPRANKFRVSESVRGTIVLLDGPQAGAIFPSVLFFGNLLNKLRGKAMELVVLNRFWEAPSQGSNKKHDLVKPSPQDEQIAWGWLQYQQSLGPNGLSLEKLKAEAVEDFRVQEAALLAQDQMQANRGAQPNAGHWGNQGAQPQWSQPASPNAGAYTPAGQTPAPTNVPPPWTGAGAGNQPSYGQPPPYVPQPPGYNGGPAVQPAGPPLPPQTPAPAPQPAAQPAGAAPWANRVVPGGEPATPEQAGY